MAMCPDESRHKRHVVWIRDVEVTTSIFAKSHYLHTLTDMAIDLLSCSRRQLGTMEKKPLHSRKGYELYETFSEALCSFLFYFSFCFF